MTWLEKVWYSFVVIVLAPMLAYCGWLGFAWDEVMRMWREE